MSEDLPKINNKDERDVWLGTYRNTHSMLFHSLVEGKELSSFNTSEDNFVSRVSATNADRALEEYKKRSGDINNF